VLYKTAFSQNAEKNRISLIKLATRPVLLTMHSIDKTMFPFVLFPRTMFISMLLKT